MRREASDKIRYFGHGSKTGLTHTREIELYVFSAVSHPLSSIGKIARVITMINRKLVTVFTSDVVWKKISILLLLSASAPGHSRSNF